MIESDSQTNGAEREYLPPRAITGLLIFMLVLSGLEVVGGAVDIYAPSPAHHESSVSPSMQLLRLLNTALVLIFGIGIWHVFRSPRLVSFQSAIVFVAALDFVYFGWNAFFHFGFEGMSLIVVKMLMIIVYVISFVALRMSPSDGVRD